MKIFVQCIFKCKRCSFSFKTNLKINEWKEVENNYNIEILKTFLETSEGHEFLQNLKLNFSVLTEFDIEKPLESENIRKVLFNIDVVDGHLECNNCGLIYPIQNSILDTVDVIEPNK